MHTVLPSLVDTACGNDEPRSEPTLVDIEESLSRVRLSLYRSLLWIATNH
jgi:hypothetical protein